MTCDNYDPDKVFQNFKLVEFPTSFVGLSTTRILDVRSDLTKSGYLKTLCQGRLRKFEEARDVSAAHRAFELEYVDEYTIKITYNPKNECVARAKLKQQDTSRFVIDLRLIQVDQARCCYNELHSEIGRFYICGKYEYSQITHDPEILNFGDVLMNNKVTKYIHMKNQSKIMTAKVYCDKQRGFCVVPSYFDLKPCTSIRLAVTFRPTCLKVPVKLTFKISNPHPQFIDQPKMANENDNYLMYVINGRISISYHKPPKTIVVESLHKLYEQLPKYTYINDELEIYNQRKAIASEYQKVCKCAFKCSCIKQPPGAKFTIDRDRCYPDPGLEVKGRNPRDFCTVKVPKISNYELFDIRFEPFCLDFGKIGSQTNGKRELKIFNKSKYTVCIRLCPDNSVTYTENMLPTIYYKIEPLKKITVTVSCLGIVSGLFKGTFEYLVDGKYKCKHPYSVTVGTPALMVKEKTLKFGMVTTESFVTSVPIRIYNHFNNSATFNWTDLHPEIPFEIIPMSGSIPAQSCKICDVIYVCKLTKTKIHEVDLISQECKHLPVELSVVTRKLSIKFLQSVVIFKDIPINTPMVEKVKLENSSREIALFYVVEPLIPGLTMAPMSGTIRPKMIMTFDIVVNIPCILEFAFDILVKINNKENLVLPVSGAVVEPKITIQPKIIYMPRIPSNLITFVPVTFQNQSTVKSEVDVVNSGDDNIFDVYAMHGSEKQKVSHFKIDEGQVKTVFIKVSDTFRREYDMYIPFKVNGLIGPPDEQNPSSIELKHFIGKHELCYENNPKVKLKTINKDICYCRINGVFTMPWLLFSVDKFEFEYNADSKNVIEFSIRNISKCYLCLTILTSKLAPYFSLKTAKEYHGAVVNENEIKVELDTEEEVPLLIKFLPKAHGKYSATAVLYLDKHMTIPYSNLTFYGKLVTPVMSPSTYRVIFPACLVGTEMTRIITIDFEEEADLEEFSCISRDETFLSVKFMDRELKTDKEKSYTHITVELKVYSEVACTGHLTLNFRHTCGSFCDIDVYFCLTFCPITLHVNFLVEPEDNPYPYYPLDTQVPLYDYLEKCCDFLEKWMFQQGFRRDLYPVIPDTFHALSSLLSSQGAVKVGGKGINVSYLNFIRRIAGPLMKHVRKITVHEGNDTFKLVKEIHDTYREIILLVKSRGGNIGPLEPKFLLSYEHFRTYSEYEIHKNNGDTKLTSQLLSDVDLFNRLNKQSWIDFILQSYKVFIMDSCFFDCVCVSSQARNITKILIDWFNDLIMKQHNSLKGQYEPVKAITNLTTDLTDGVALTAAIIHYCPFLKNHFSIFVPVEDDNREGNIVNNACLIIEAMNILKLYFPLCSKDFFEPNFLQMLFLSIHLYVTLPMFKPRDTIILTPALLKSSYRLVGICPSSQESLLFTYNILNNNRNAFFVEKAPSGDNGKKVSLFVKYTANFVENEECMLLMHGYNKTRIFDTYVVFILHGRVGALNPERKCKVTGPLYRTSKVDIMIASPFQSGALFKIEITDTEPSMPVKFQDVQKSRFYVRRLNLIDKEIYLNGTPKEASQDDQLQKVYLQIVCLNTQVGNSWVWFRSEVGQFFVKVTTQARWDLALDSLETKVHEWPLYPCTCGEACECDRTSAIMIPNRNELMQKSLRYALIENASASMLNIFDHLIDTNTGKIILAMLLEEGGTNMFDLQHILRSESTFRVTSRTLQPRAETITLSQHTSGHVMLPVTVPAGDKSDKFSITLTSICGMDVRTYKVVIIESPMLTEIATSSISQEDPRLKSQFR